jgi:hypothetical protein
MGGSERVGAGGSGGGVMPLRPDCEAAFEARVAARKKSAKSFLMGSLRIKGTSNSVRFATERFIPLLERRWQDALVNQGSVQKLSPE